MAQESPSTEIREEIATQLAQLKPLEFLKMNTSLLV